MSASAFYFYNSHASIEEDPYRCSEEYGRRCVEQRQEAEESRSCGSHGPGAGELRRSVYSGARAVPRTMLYDYARCYSHLIGCMWQ